MSKEGDANPPAHSCEEVDELLGGFALDSLEAAEEAKVRGHIDGCPACRAEVAELRAAVLQLGEAVAEVAPPAELRERVLAQVRGEGEAAAQAATGSAVGPPSRWRRRWWEQRLAPWVATAAVAVLALAAGGWGLSEHFSTSSTGAGVELSSVGLNPVDRLIASGDATVISLSPGHRSRAQGALITDPSTGTTYLLLSRVPTLHTPQVYALWYMVLKNGALTPVRIGQVLHAGAFRLARSPSGFAQMALTREPRPGDTRPRGPVLLTAQVN